MISELGTQAAFKLGDKVDRAKGQYRFPGTVIGYGQTANGEMLYMVEMDGYGLVHHFREKQLVRRDTQTEEIRRLRDALGRIALYGEAGSEVWKIARNALAEKPND